ncbi:MAG: hypothetical protein HY551_03855 [Elusimicrobia bacterium]|nr:hypothetical protein [Elusimicrobiota bacterium]
MPRPPGILPISLGLAGLAASSALLYAGTPWMATFFYLCAWSSYLVVIHGLNLRWLGDSHGPGTTAEHFRCAWISVPWWLFFELLNARLQNWAYDGLPAARAIRWGGYAIAFSTVLPAILETASAIQKWLGREKTSAPRLRIGPGRLKAATLLGWMFLLIPLVWPRYFFPLIWVAVFLLTEPWLIRNAPESSWLFLFSQGRPNRMYSLLLSGAVCGVLWESLNFWAGARWVYTIPWPQEPKLFEMPWLGYLGFPPFALECASFYSFFKHAWKKSSRVNRVLFSISIAIFCLGVFFIIDRWTLRSTLPLGPFK